MAARSNTLSRDLSCAFTIGSYDARNPDEYSAVSKACGESFGFNSFVCLQVLTAGKFQITFRQQSTVNRALTDGLRYNNQIVPVSPVSDNQVTLTIRYLPHELGDNVVTTHLLPYGQTVKIERIARQEPGGMHENGDRRVIFKMKTAVPNFLRICSYTAMVTYRGVLRTCRRCQKEGHIASECKEALRCEHCSATDHVSQRCRSKARATFASVTNTDWADRREDEDTPMDDKEDTQPEDRMEDQDQQEKPEEIPSDAPERAVAVPVDTSTATQRDAAPKEHALSEDCIVIPRLDPAPPQSIPGSIHPPAKPKSTDLRPKAPRKSLPGDLKPTDFIHKNKFELLSTDFPTIPASKPQPNTQNQAPAPVSSRSRQSSTSSERNELLQKNNIKRAGQPVQEPESEDSDSDLLAVRPARNRKQNKIDHGSTK